MSTMFNRIKAAMNKKGYTFFNNGNYNLNLVGVRSIDTNANTFNDALYVVFLIDGVEQAMTFPMTTDPGVYWRKHPINVSGTAIVKPGQYPGLWKIGKHKKQYDALVQERLVTVLRDVDCNGELAGHFEETGVYGINCHRASSFTESKLVDKWSAGCQVLSDPLDFDLLMALCHKAASIYGNSFTYTLLTEDELWNR